MKQLILLASLMILPILMIAYAEDLTFSANLFDTPIFDTPICDLELESLNIDFGNVYRGGQSLPQTVTIINIGNQPINSLEIGGSTWQGERAIFFPSITTASSIGDFSDTQRIGKDFTKMSLMLSNPLEAPIQVTDESTSDIIFRLDLRESDETTQGKSLSGTMTSNLHIDPVCNS